MENDRNSRLSVEQTGGPEVQTDVKEALLWKRSELTRELRALDATISEVQSEYSSRLQQLQAQKKPLEDALHHVAALLEFEGHYGTQDVGGDRGASAIAAGISITDAAFNLLERLHQPVHYKDIAARLRERDIYIPGKDPAATLLSRMCRDSRFKRTSKRGTYALSTWRVTNPEPTDTPVDGDTGHMKEPIRHGLSARQPIVAHPRTQDIGVVWDLVVSDRIRNGISLFAAGICYGRAG